MINDNDHQVIVIKDDEDESEDCNHKISYLRSQRFCQRKAKLCKQVCLTCEKHGHPTLKKEHTNISVDSFNKAFKSLEETCSKQTEHYIRQINQTQKKAIEAIRKKKQEYFSQIEEIKIHLMKKTYRTLQEKYPSLYQKFKNNRLDTLKCCQVFWVLNTPPINHHIKHSEINKKLEAILKKFQNFKDVSRNIHSENIFSNKERAKKSKIAEKIEKPAEKITQKEDMNINREKVNFYSEAEEKYKREIDKLSRQLTSFRERKKNAEQELRRLDYEIRNLNYMRLRKTRRLDIVKGVVNYQNYPNKNEDQQVYQQRPQWALQPLISPPKQKKPPLPQQMQLQAQLSSNENHLENQMQEQQPQQNQEPVKEKQVSPQKQHENHHEEVNIEEQQEEVAPLPQQQQIEQGEVQDASKEANKQVQDHLPSNLHALSHSEPEKAPQQPNIKVEYNSDPFQPWENQELLSQMRTYGKRVQHALKVQDIDVLSTLPFITPPKNLFKFTPQKQSEIQKKPSAFKLIADKLFMRYNESKKGQDKDKPQ